MSDGMTPSKWEAEYSEGTPHWAKDMAPTEFAKDFAKELERRKLTTVLEIGCGNGRDSIYFAKKGLKVTAVDVAPSAVKLAQENVEKAKVNVDVQIANAEHLQFPSDSFGAVYSLSVLHATRLGKSLEEVYRVLRRGGFAFIYIYGDTQTKTGIQRDGIGVDKYITALKFLGFTIWDFYTEQEDKYDQYGEKHKLFVAKLGKG